ncbi:MAG: GyrI-like domain-containing protein [Pseudomonadota bacterium]|nr:GyrI-like domain-containing protein [Pseudomonadota bacterium]
MDIVEKTFDKQHYLYVDGQASMGDPAAIAQAMGSAFVTAYAFMESEGISPISKPLTVYSEMPGVMIKFRSGFLVKRKDAQLAAGDVKSGKIPACTALHAVHHGPYMQLNKTHAAIWGHAKKNGLTSAVPVWEIYIDDPQTTPHDELRTEVYHRLG